MSRELSTERRPGVVTFIGIIVVLQGILAMVAAIVLVAFRENDSIQEATSQTGAALAGAAIGEAIVGLLLLFVGFGVLRGNRGARFLVALAQSLGMALATWLLLTHHGGGYTTRSLITLLIGVFVLWALYGHEDSNEYFEGDL